MRIARRVLTVQADIAHQLQNAILTLLLGRIELMDIQRLADDIRNRHAGIQRRIRILKHHRSLLAEGLDIVLRHDLPAVVVNLTRRGLVKVQDCAADGGLAAAGFADQTQRLARFDGEAHIVHGLEGLGAEQTHIDIEVFFQVSYIDDRLCVFILVHFSAPPFSSGFSSAASSSEIVPSSTPFLTFIQQAAI